MLSVILFLSYTAILAVLLIIVAPTPVHSVLFGLLFYIAFGCIFIFSGYDFIGVALIIVYAGALMVMFLFVLMAFDLTRSAFVLGSFQGNSNERWGRTVVLLFFFGLFSRVLRYVYVISLGSTVGYSLYPSGCIGVFDGYILFPVIFCQNASLLEEVGITFYPGFAVPVVLCGILLVVGLIGAVALTEVCRPLRTYKRVSYKLHFPGRVSRRVVNLRCAGSSPRLVV